MCRRIIRTVYGVSQIVSECMVISLVAFTRELLYHRATLAREANSARVGVIFQETTFFTLGQHVIKQRNGIFLHPDIIWEQVSMVKATLACPKASEIILGLAPTPVNQGAQNDL